MDAEEPQAAALAYAVRGWPVFPLSWPLASGACACGRPDCDKPGKHPLCGHGLYDATTDPEAIRRWWSRRPQANVGIRTGTASGVLVLDVDGAVGMETLRRLRDAAGSLRAAWARSGSGGWHAYLRLSEGTPVPSSAGRLGPGLDIRADGGSIVAPPSRHASGARYRWLKPEVEPPPAPDWLLRLARRPLIAPARPLSAVLAQVTDRYAEAAIRGEAQAVAGAPHGTRNHRLNYAAWRLGRLVAAGIADELAVFDALLSAGVSAGLPEHEAIGTIRSGLSAGTSSPHISRSSAAPTAVEPVRDVSAGGLGHA